MAAFRPPSEQKFQRLWRVAKKHPFVLRAGPPGAEVFPQDPRNYIYLDLFQAFDRLNIDFAPRVTPVNERPFLGLLATKAPLMLLAPHSEIATSLNPLLERLSVDWAVISSSDEVKRRSKWLGMKGTVATIPDSSDCLLIARQGMRQGKVIFCCPDFPLYDQKTGRFHAVISPVAFDFARRAGAKLIYGMPVLTDDGGIDYHFSDPRNAMDHASAEALVADFLDYIGAFPGANADLPLARAPIK